MTEKKTPKHIGVILDGNRRFAKSLNLTPWKGHEYGEKKIFKLLGWCKELGIREVTVYAFSVQNFSRPKKEFDYLMDLFKKFSKKLKEDPRVISEGVRVRVLGDTSLFPSDVAVLLKELVNKTKKNKDYFFNVALGYGGREEIVRATKLICSKVKKGILSLKDIDEDCFSNHLYLKSEPDFIIRTGGDHRTSNFLPWQSTYSEWFFLKKTWPEFEKEDLVNCVNDFLNRERRFGK